MTMPLYMASDPYGPSGSPAAARARHPVLRVIPNAHAEQLAELIATLAIDGVNGVGAIYDTAGRVHVEVRAAPWEVDEVRRILPAWSDGIPVLVVASEMAVPLNAAGQTPPATPAQEDAVVVQSQWIRRGVLFFTFLSVGAGLGGWIAHWFIPRAPREDDPSESRP